MKYKTLTMKMLEEWACDEGIEQFRPLIGSGLVLDEAGVAKLLRELLRWQPDLYGASAHANYAVLFLCGADRSVRAANFAAAFAFGGEEFAKARIGACMAEILHWSRGGK